jgi:hypothetical protein
MSKPKKLWDARFKEFDIVVAQLSETAFTARAWDSQRNAVCNADASDPHVAQAELIEHLRPYTAAFVGFDEAVHVFKKAFPWGFDDAYYEFRERGYKLRVKKAFNAPARNLLASFEHTKVNEALKNEPVCREVAREVATHLHSAPATFIEHFAAIMRPYGAGTWPVATYLPFLLMPEREMLLKPEVMKLFADRVGHEIEYRPRPNAETYGHLISLAELTEKALEVRSCPPNDKIDVHSFIWAISHDGYVQNAIDDRAQKGFGDRQA